MIHAQVGTSVKTRLPLRGLPSNFVFLYLLVLEVSQDSLTAQMDSCFKTTNAGTAQLAITAELDRLLASAQLVSYATVPLPIQILTHQVMNVQEVNTAA